MQLFYIISFICAVVLAFVLTPPVIRFAHRVGALDKPNHRKVHTRLMPRLGGLAIFLAFAGTFLVMYPFMPELDTKAIKGVLLGGSIIILVGAFDDKYELSPKLKLIGQIIAAGIVVGLFDMRIDFVNIPFGSVIAWDNFEWLSITITMVWIVGVTNAVNLIDGLDGLAAGVSAIATASLLVIALFMGNMSVVLLCLLLLGSIIGFLFFNFHPAKIFMGDSGALFLGFSLATISVLGFKSATLVSFVIPLLILGVPLSDTFLAIVRRVVNKKPISVADKSHLHHCLLHLGFGHRTTVLIIYAVAAMFGGCAILGAYTMSQNMNWVTLIITLAVLLVVEICAEAIGIIGKKNRPVLTFLRRAHLFTVQLFTK